MLAALIIGVYTAGFIYTFRCMYVAIMDNEFGNHSRRPDNEDRVLHMVMAATLSAIWPLTLIGRTVLRHGLPKTEVDRRHELEGRELAVRDRERAVSRLERELGIGDKPS